MVGLALALLVLVPEVLVGRSMPWMDLPKNNAQAAGRSAALTSPSHVQAGVRVRSTIHAAPDAKGLQLPATDFAPATVATSASRTGSEMDDLQTWPRIHHSLSYGELGLSSGYVQSAGWKPAGSVETVTFGYAGSVFATEPGAYDAWHDGATFWPGKYNNIQAVPCPAIAAPVCSRWNLAGTNGITEWDDSIQLGQCLIETRTFAPATLFTAQQSQIAGTLADIDRSAVEAAMKVCGVPAPAGSTPAGHLVLGIDDLRVEMNNAGPDWALARPPIEQVGIGQPLSLSLYYTVRNPPARSQAKFHVMVRTGGRVVLDEHDRPYTLSPSLTQYRHTVRFVPRSSGTYIVTERVAVGGLSVSGIISFLAGKKVAVHVAR